MACIAFIRIPLHLHRIIMHVILQTKYQKKLIHPLSVISKVILNTRLEQRTMSQEMMDELRKSQEALKEELNLLKSQMRWVLETLQVLLRKEGHPIYTAATKRATTPHPSSVTSSQGKFHVEAPHLPAYGPPPRCHHQHPLAIPPQNHQIGRAHV